MENEIIDNEEEGIYIKEIEGIKCLHYKLEYKDSKILNDPRFLKWLNDEKKSKKSYLSMCTKCNTFKYTGENIKCCNHPYFEPICTSCGRRFAGDSYCCAKRGIVEVSSRYILDGSYTCGLYGDRLFNCFKAIPFIFNLVFIGTLYYGIFLHRSLKNNKRNNKKISSYEQIDTACGTIAINISFLCILVLSFVYFLPFIPIYFIYLIIFFKNYSK